MFPTKLIYWVGGDYGNVYAQSSLHVLVNVFIEYVHPTNWLLDNVDLLINLLADIDGELNLPFDNKFEPDEGCVSAPWIMGINRILHIPIDVLLNKGSYPCNVIIILPTLTF